MGGKEKAEVLDKDQFVELGNLDVADVVTGKKNGKKRGRRRLDRPVVKVSLIEIVEGSPTQKRRDTFDPGAYPEDKELLQSVRENGVLEPIMLTRFSDLGGEAKYRIVFGHRRVEAARRAGLEEITAIIAKNDDDLHLLTLVENTGGRALTAYEKALSLVEIKKQEPDLTIRELGTLTGIQYSHVSDLIRAYRDSTPALRGLFAEGAGARTIVVLQEILGKLEDGRQKKLCSAIKGITTQDAQSARDMVEAGLSPENAIRSVLGERSGPDPAKNEAPRKAKRDTTSNDHSQVATLAQYSGASERTVERLLKKVSRDGASLRAVTFACAYKARGGRRRDALQLAERVAEDKRLSTVIYKYLDTLAKSRKALKKVEDKNVARFVTTIVNGGNHGG